MMTRPLKHAVLVLLIGTAACWPFPRVIKEGQHISRFTVDANHVFFGAGYALYRLDLTAPSIQPVFATDRIRVEQPIVADGIAYVGGRRYANASGRYGERDGFFAVDLKTGRRLWTFHLSGDGYGTFGTYPSLVGDDRILVCDRRHLYCLNRHSGSELWRLDNWFGDASGSTLPYVYKDSVYYKIVEQGLVTPNALDGSWAKVSLDSGRRTGVLPIAKWPGHSSETEGQAVGTLADGVVYGALRYIHYMPRPTTRFAAVQLESGTILWEVVGGPLQTRPAVTDQHVITLRDGAVQALDRRSGAVAWTDPLLESGIDGMRAKNTHDPRWSHRFAASDIVVVQSSHRIEARNAVRGTVVWSADTETEVQSGDADPVIVGDVIVASAAQTCSLFALDRRTGREVWRIPIPDCRTYHVTW